MHQRFQLYFGKIVISSIIDHTYLWIRRVLLFSVILYGVSASDVDDGIRRPIDAERIIAKAVVKLVSKHHFPRKKLDDELSERLFNTYFTSLDPQKLYFLRSDIDHYSDYKLILDESLVHGQIEFAYRVFDAFVERVEERILYIEKRLHKSFDFSLDEELLVDRKSASWCIDAKELDNLWSLRLKNDVLNRVLKPIDGEKKEQKREARDILNETLKGKNYKKIIIGDLLPDITYDKMAVPYRNYLQRLNARDSIDILEKFLTTLSKLYDPYSAYLAPKTKEDFDISMKLSLEGIGARLKEVNGEIIVKEIIAGGAADKEGRLKEKDRIVAVSQDGVTFIEVKTMSLRNVIGLVRGPKQVLFFLR